MRIAQGCTNRQIAEELVIAQRTVDTHVERILAKLGFNTRAQVAAWAATEGPPVLRPAEYVGGVGHLPDSRYSAARLP